MDNQTEEGVITFGQIWRVVKKSLARAMIYVFVCAVICFAALFAVKTVKVNNTYSARITFSQSDSSIKATLDNYRSTAANKAVTEVFGSSTEASATATTVYEAVLKSLTITAYVPGDYSEDTTFIATTFTVSFSDLGISGVTSEQQVSLLANICDELVSYYTDINSTDTLEGGLAWGYTVNYNVEYLDILCELDSRLSTLKTTLSANIEANVEINGKFATYKTNSTSSNRRTAYEILAQIDNLELEVSYLKESVYNNGITNSKATLNCSNGYCAAKLITLQNKYAELKSVADEYETQLDNLANVIQGSNSGSATSGTITIDLSEYTSLVEKLIDIKMEMASITTQISQVNTLQQNLETDATVNAANMATTEATINALLNEVSELIEEYNDLVEDFETYGMTSYYATISMPATANSNSIISTTLLVVAVIAVAILAYVVAFGQTWSVMKKAGTLNGGKAVSKEQDAQI